MSMPAASARFASAFGKAEPPITILRPVKSTLALAAASSNICRMVGTPMGEGNAFALDQLDQHRRLIAPGVDLLDPGECRRPGETPGMDVKHRCDRHVDVVTRETALRAGHAEQCQACDRVQHELPVAVIDALGQSGRAGRVKVVAWVFSEGEVGDVVAEAIAQIRRETGRTSGFGLVPAGRRAIDLAT